MNKLALANKSIWSAIFLLGSAVTALLEWDSGQPGALGWFLFTGLWSAFCGIGYTLCDWFIRP